MRVWIVLVSSMLALMLPRPTGAQADPPGCDSAKHRQFDFWIGEWEVTQPDGTVAGTNRIETILEGCVLMENWQGARGLAGKSFNHYFERDGKWRQTWVDAAGARLDLVGGLEGDRMVLQGTMPGANGEPVLHEISWQPHEDGSVTQHWRASGDGGESWQDVFVGVYRRIDG